MTISVSAAAWASAGTQRTASRARVMHSIRTSHQQPEEHVPVKEMPSLLIVKAGGSRCEITFSPPGLSRNFVISVLKIWENNKFSFYIWNALGSQCLCFYHLFMRLKIWLQSLWESLETCFIIMTLLWDFFSILINITGYIFMLNGKKLSLLLTHSGSADYTW